MDYSFVDTIQIWWHGKWQRTLWEIDKWVPYVHPEKEGNKAPSWWRDWYASWTWEYYLDDNDRPTEHWLDLYDPAARDLFHTWFNRLKDSAVGDAANWVWSWTGGPQHGYATLADWLEAAWTRVQSELPEWIWQVSGAITTAYNDLKTWARSQYDAAVAKVAILWTWLQGTGSLLSAFYDQVGVFIADFAQNPSTVILGVLGGTWARLVTFDQGALGYFYDLWGSYRQTLADFLADPLGWIYDQVEDFLVGKW